MTQMIDAGQNPALANDIIASAVADDKPVAAEVKVPPIEQQPDCNVTLFAGRVNQIDGTTTTDAVVRELTGVDEEILTSPTVSRNPAKFLQAVTGRGTVSIGGEKPKAADFDALLIGDREMLLLAIRKATYGDEVDLVTVCPHCEDRDEDFHYDLNGVPVRHLERVEDAIYGFTVELPSGKTAKVSLPRAGDQDALLTATGKNLAELDTLMLSRVVQQLDGDLVIGDAKLRNLSVKDRRALLKAVNERTPGPRLGEAKRICRACEQEFDLGIGLLDIFRT